MKQFPRGLIVSSQALAGNPLRDSERLAVMAEAAAIGGASAIRANGVSDIAAIRRRVSLPIIGIDKRQDETGRTVITPDFAGAKAIARALLGHISPGGKLPISLPRHSTRIPCYYSMLPGGDLQFLEGPKGPLYAFGHGLSYASFEYSDLRIEKTWPVDVQVCCTVTNTGTVEADEVVQLYIDDVDSSVVTPLKLLKDFRRISLAPGEGREVRFTLGNDHFKLMDIRYNWTVEPGRFRILVGSGSEDIRLEGEVIL